MELQGFPYLAFASFFSQELLERISLPLLDEENVILKGGNQDEQKSSPLIRETEVVQGALVQYVAVRIDLANTLKKKKMNTEVGRITASLQLSMAFSIVSKYKVKHACYIM